MSLLPKTDATGDPVYVYDAVKQLALHFTFSSRTESAKRVDKMLTDRDTRISELLNTIADKDAKLERYQHENAQLRGLIGNLRRPIAAALQVLGVTVEQLTEAHRLPIPQPPRREPDVEVRQ